MAGATVQPAAARMTGVKSEYTGNYTGQMAGDVVMLWTCKKRMSGLLPSPAFNPGQSYSSTEPSCAIPHSGIPEAVCVLSFSILRTVFGTHAGGCLPLIYNELWSFMIWIQLPVCLKLLFLFHPIQVNQLWDLGRYILLPHRSVSAHESSGWFYECAVPSTMSEPQQSNHTIFRKWCKDILSFFPCR